MTSYIYEAVVGKVDKIEGATEKSHHHYVHHHPNGVQPGFLSRSAVLFPPQQFLIF